MTKARDLAGFSTGSITNTTADGLILKGDGSSTDVVIKNGANATVATVSDGSTNLSVAGSVTGALARGAIQVGNSSGVAAALAKGAAGTVLTSDGTDLSYAAIPSSGYVNVTFPSDWNSPSANYTTSGTWSKGSLDDDAYVWFYLLGGGGGGAGNNNESWGASGGRAALIWARVKDFDGAAYVIGAGRAGTSSYAASGGGNLTPSDSTITLTSSNGSRVFSTNANYGLLSGGIGKTDVINTTGSLTSLQQATETFSSTLPTGYTMMFNDNNGGSNAGAGGSASATLAVFAGGQGAPSFSGSIRGVQGTSLFAGNGGFSSQGAAGIAPGGGGAGNSGGTGGAGANGSLRVYEV